MLPLAPLQQRFGIEKLFVSTMQAVSGAGYPGVASLDILGNVIPYIKNEEEKLQEEVAKLLGTASDGRLPARRPHPSPPLQPRRRRRRPHRVRQHQAPQARDARADPRRLGRASSRSTARVSTACICPPRPLSPVEYAPEDTRPQPRLDLMRGNGMATTVGRLRPCSLFDWKFTLLSHNTIRGAAGAAILNAEILAVLGKFDFRAFPPMNSSAQVRSW